MQCKDFQPFSSTPAQLSNCKPLHNPTHYNTKAHKRAQLYTTQTHHCIYHQWVQTLSVKE